MKIVLILASDDEVGEPCQIGMYNQASLDADRMDVLSQVNWLENDIRPLLPLFNGTYRGLSYSTVQYSQTTSLK